MVALEVAILSERGGRAHNEDACGYWSSERQVCCVLADGAGGHGGGDVASRLAVQNLLESFAGAPASGGAALSHLVRGANRAVRAARVPGTPQADMHTTIVCLVIDFIDARADWVHCGDSRLYWFRDRRLARRTRDHSLVASLVDAGVIGEAQTRSHPERSVLLSALGKEEEEIELAVSDPAPLLAEGDAFLLCSDGIWEHLPDAMLEDLLAQARTPQEWLGAIERAVAHATRARATYDNYTAMAVWVGAAPAT